VSNPYRESTRAARGVGTLLCALVVAGPVGCERTPRITVAPATQPAAELAGSPFDPSLPTRYVLYPGDRILVRFPTEATLDQEVRIRSDGMISLPYVGDVPAAGRAPAELAADLNRRYTILKKAEVAVIVLEESGRRVYIGGQVRTPGALPLSPSQTLTQAIFEAGGLTPQARREEVVVIRARPGDATYVLKADLGRILAGQEPDVRLEPFDIVHVPETIIARVDQFVEQYVNSVIPRAAIFTFTTELKSQPIKVINNRQPSATPSVSITRP